jgi:hypothetical protein
MKYNKSVNKTTVMIPPKTISGCTPLRSHTHLSEYKKSRGSPIGLSLLFNGDHFFFLSRNIIPLNGVRFILILFPEYS